MIIRGTEPKDFNRVLQLYKQQDYWPNFTNGNAVIVAEHDGDVVGFGYVRRILEGTILIDQEMRMRDKVNCLNLIMNEIQSIKDFDRIHAFIRNEKFAKILMKHFDFVTTSGKALHLELNNGK